ncbi:MAG TPA: NAD(P)/FAD-dependent oxidoreductase [Caulobacteraceae bacterium]|nr:NAD(P)/FAD-dependent oxidoreductase [Caulobacteraceae bacterium]
MNDAIERHDVVIVGSGIAGSALAFALARRGLDVLVLEQSETYPDRVRGEVMVQWGVKEAQTLGLEAALLAAGGRYSTRFIGYDEVFPADAVEAAPIPLGDFIPGVPGMLCITHPAHCQALIDSAASAGAKVVRGAQVETVEGGAAPLVKFTSGGQATTAHARIVVGADGRASQTREALGVRLTVDRPRDLLCGMLVKSAEGWDPDVISIGVEGDLCYSIFPQADGRARLYGFWSIDDRSRFTGADGPAHFLSAYQLECCPKAGAIAGGRQAGPLVTFLNNESSTEAPFVEGGVLIGDAAGWTDPIIGCGLSSAYRDARIVSEVLLGSSDWSPSAFADYAAERKERHRRIKFVSEVTTTLNTTFDQAGRDRRRRFFERAPTDPQVGGLLVANLAGPEAMPPEFYTSSHRAYLVGPQ